MAAMADSDLARIIGSSMKLERIVNPNIPVYDIRDYVIKKSLSKGGYGETFLVEKEGVEYIMKKNLRITKMITNDFVKETTLLKLFNQYPQTKSVKLEAFVYDSENEDTIYLILEKLDIDLYDLVRKKIQDDRNQIKILFYKLINAFLSIHQLGFIHSDIKLENIMIKNDDIRIIDFGMAKFIGLKPSFKTIEALGGTPSTLAPDATNISDYFDGNRVSFASDVFSLGMVFGQILYSTSKRINIDVGTFQIDKNYYPYIIKIIGDEGFDLILRMTTKNALNRITLKEALEHPFFTGITREMILDRTIIGGNLGEYLKTTTFGTNMVNYSIRNLVDRIYELKYLEELKGNYEYQIVPQNPEGITETNQSKFIQLFLWLIVHIKKTKYEYTGLYKSVDFNVLINTIINLKSLYKLILEESFLVADGDMDFYKELILTNYLLILNYNIIIFTYGALPKETITGIAGQNRRIYRRSFNLFSHRLNIDLYPIWIQMVYIESKLKAQILDERIEDIYDELRGKACLVMITILLSFTKLPEDLTFWDLSRFCYLKILKNLFKMTTVEVLNAPKFDWLIIDKSKYDLLEEYLEKSKEFILNNSKTLTDKAIEIFENV
jgi:serine/threonine protein kinase